MLRARQNEIKEKYLIFKNIINVKNAQHKFLTVFNDANQLFKWGRIKKSQFIHLNQDFLTLNLQMVNIDTHKEIQLTFNKYDFENATIKCYASISPEEDNHDFETKYLPKMYVKHLPEDTTEEELYNHINRHTDVIECIINKIPNTRKAYAFVHLKSYFSLEYCVNKIDGSKFKGVNIRAEKAYNTQPPSEYAKRKANSQQQTKASTASSNKTNRFSKSIVNSNKLTDILEEDEVEDWFEEIEREKANSKAQNNRSTIDSSINTSAITTDQSKATTTNACEHGKIQFYRRITIKDDTERIEMTKEIPGMKIKVTVEVESTPGTRIAFNLFSDVINPNVKLED
jgi:hypothetical protein